MANPEIRKIVAYFEDVLIEGRREVPRPTKLAVTAAVIRNPWRGDKFTENLKPAILSHATVLGEVLVPRLMELVGGANAVEAYGKAAVVGTDGEVEHASALIHTLRFGNQLREAVGGTSYLSFTNKRAGPGCSIDIPMAHITSSGTRSHFLTISFTIPDAPAADEIVVAIGVATAGRPHHRIGDRYEDMKEMGISSNNTALKDD
jgi:amino acid synthesis protein